MKKLVGKVAGQQLQVYAKIKSLKGLENIDEILTQADGVTLQRGHLSMELGFQHLNYIQQHIVKKCKAESKMLGLPTRVRETGMKGSIPLLYEVNDIIQAVVSGIDSIVLSVETAIGEFYEESIHSCRQVIEEAESQIDYVKQHKE